jgi:type I restriction enzyme S subunit
MKAVKPYLRYRPSGIPWIGDVPEYWELKPLFTTMREIDDRNYGNKVQNVLSLSYGKIVDRDVESNFGLLPESFETYQIVEKGDVILRLTDLQNDQRSLRVGSVGRKGIITSAYVCLRGLEHAIAPEYAFWLLATYDFKKVFYGLGSGVRQVMGFVDLKRLPVVLPKIEEQRNIAAFLDHTTAQLDDLIAQKQRLIEALCVSLNETVALHVISV